MGSRAMIESLFSTPFYETNKYEIFSGIHDEIIEYIMSKRNPEAPKYSLQGTSAYHTEPNLTDLDYMWSKLLKGMILDCSSQAFKEMTNQPLPKCRIDCWGVVLGPGDISAPHVHPGSEISGVYYLHIPDNLLPGEGVIRLIDPRPAARYSKVFAGQSMNIIPTPGQVLIFPSWIEHLVTAHTSGQARVSVSWNVIF